MAALTTAALVIGFVVLALLGVLAIMALTARWNRKLERRARRR